MSIWRIRLSNAAQQCAERYRPGQWSDIAVLSLSSPEGYFANAIMRWATIRVTEGVGKKRVVYYITPNMKLAATDGGRSISYSWTDPTLSRVEFWVARRHIDAMMRLATPPRRLSWPAALRLRATTAAAARFAKIIRNCSGLLREADWRGVRYWPRDDSRDLPDYFEVDFIATHPTVLNPAEHHRIMSLEGVIVPAGVIYEWRDLTQWANTDDMARVPAARHPDLPTGPNNTVMCLGLTLIELMIPPSGPSYDEANEMGGVMPRKPQGAPSKIVSAVFNSDDFTAGGDA